jgi:hypothetical protein
MLCGRRNTSSVLVYPLEHHRYGVHYSLVFMTPSFLKFTVPGARDFVIFFCPLDLFTLWFPVYQDCCSRDFLSKIVTFRIE